LKIETTELLQIHGDAGVTLEAFDLRATLESIAASDALQTEAKQLVADVVRKLPAGASEEAIFGSISLEDLISEARELLLNRSGAGEGGRS
jgi:hypothetical protein